MFKSGEERVEYYHRAGRFIRATNAYNTAGDVCFIKKNLQLLVDLPGPNTNTIKVLIFSSSAVFHMFKRSLFTEHS